MTGNQICQFLLPSSRKIVRADTIAPTSASPSSSPLRSSPLAHGAIYSSTSTRALPIPRRPSQSTSSLRRTSISMSMSPNLSTSTSTQKQTPSPTASPASLSRSQSLLGSYPLSLIHSRMSHAHQPHSSITEFSLHLKAIGQGKGCPTSLRCPKSLDLPFVATYYDLEDPGRAGPIQTPWVGTVDLEEYYHDLYTSPPLLNTVRNEVDPPVHPGYRVAPVGQLQMIVKTPTNAIKVFVVPYDLRDLPVGGRLLARERTYVRTDPISPGLGTSNGSPVDKGKKEILRYAYQLQFICIADPPTTTTRRESSTTRQTSTTSTEGKGYYLSKSLRLVFTATPPESDQGQTLRTERTNEIVPSSGIPSTLGGGGRRRSSVGFQTSPGKIMLDWSIVRQKWLAKRQLDSESALEMNEEEHVNTLPPIKSPATTRSTTPIPQPFNVPNSNSNSSAVKVHPPPSPRFARRQLRRTSAEERELSEQLRKAGLE
jgi:hypothetical protein